MQNFDAPGVSKEGVFYQPVGSCWVEVKENDYTNYPILLVMESVIENKAEEDYLLIAVKQKNPRTDMNETLLRENLSERGFRAGCMQVIELEEKQDVDMTETMILEIIRKFQAGDNIYASLEYGTKPASFSMLYALQMAENVPDIDVEGVFYGEVTRGKDMDPKDYPSRLNDISHLFYLTSALQNMTVRNAEELEFRIQDMLSMGKSRM